MVSLALPPETSLRFIDEFYQGIEEMAQRFDTTLVGGDISASPSHLIINISLLGETKEGHFISRSNARMGEGIFVTGNLGDAALGLEILKNRGKEPQYSALIEKQLSPYPRVEEGMVIAEKGVTSAMIDISDGLLADLGHILRESRVGAIIWQDKLPLSESFKKYAPQFSPNPLEFALSGGEDYELLFTSPQEKVSLLYESCNQFKITHIGEIIQKSGEIKIVSHKKVRVKNPGFDHFL